MRLKRDIPVLLCSVLLAAAAVSLVFTVQAFTDQLMEQSLIRVFVDQDQPARRAAAQIAELDGVIKVEAVEADQAAAEFAAVLGYPWPGDDLLPGYADVIVDPVQAAEVVDGLGQISGIDYVAYHPERLEQLAGLGELLRRVQSLLILVAVLAAAYLIWRTAGLWQRGRRKQAAQAALAVALLIGIAAPLAVHAQTATELRQVYREVQSALEKLQKEYSELEQEADSLQAEITAQEKDHAGRQSMLQQAESEMKQLTAEISKIQSQLEQIRQDEQGQAQQYGQALARLQEAAGTAARGRVEQEAGAGLFLDYLVYTSGRALAAASAGWKESRTRETQLTQELAGLEQKREQAEQQIAELKLEVNKITRELSKEKQRLIEVRQKLSSLKRMIYTQESKVWQGKRELRNKIGFTDFIWPLAVKGVVSSDYGLRLHPIIKEERFHTGVDLASAAGTAIKAAADGVVVLSQELSGYGQTVIIDHGGGVSTLYGHASELLVEAGEKVRAGETIALVGSTGLSTGPHLHFEVRQDQQHVDPWIWLG